MVVMVAINVMSIVMAMLMAADGGDGDDSAGGTDGHHDGDA